MSDNTMTGMFAAIDNVVSLFTSAVNVAQCPVYDGPPAMDDEDPTYIVVGCTDLDAWLSGNPVAAAENGVQEWANMGALSASNMRQENFNVNGLLVCNTGDENRPGSTTYSDLRFKAAAIIAQLGSVLRATTDNNRLGTTLALNSGFAVTGVQYRAGGNGTSIVVPWSVSVNNRV